MLLLKIDKQCPEPVYRQIAQQVVKLVQSDALRAGDVLPPTRELAATLSVSRFTVAQAYEELWAQGYTESRQGSNTRIRARPKLISRSSNDQAQDLAKIRVSAATLSLTARQRRASLPKRATKDDIDFSSLTLDPRLFPVDELRSAFSRMLHQQRSALLNYADPAGYAPLREFVAARMQRHGIDIKPTEVLITHGSQQGLVLVVRLLVNPGQAVVIEQPTYSSVAPMLEAHGSRVVGVPMLDDGMDLDALTAHLRRRHDRGRPALVYSIPSFHNPTGITTSQSHRERLLALCERYGTPLVEDGFQEEVTFFGKTVLPIKSMDRRGIVFYLGSFSKVFVPGLRIGWIATRQDVVSQLALLKYVEDLSCSPFVQAALHRFCVSGEYELHLRRINRTLATRMRRAITALRAHLPKSRVHFSEPSGGYLLWLRLDGSASGERDLLLALEAEGIVATPGSLFYLNRAPGLALRLSISSLTGEQIEEGACRLGRALRRLYRS